MTRSCVAADVPSVLMVTGFSAGVIPARAGRVACRFWGSTTTPSGCSGRVGAWVLRSVAGVTAEAEAGAGARSEPITSISTPSGMSATTVSAVRGTASGSAGRGRCSFSGIPRVTDSPSSGAESAGAGWLLANSRVKFSPASGADRVGARLVSAICPSNGTSLIPTTGAALSRPTALCPADGTAELRTSARTGARRIAGEPTGAGWLVVDATVAGSSGSVGGGVAAVVFRLGSACGIATTSRGPAAGSWCGKIVSEASAGASSEIVCSTTAAALGSFVASGGIVRGTRCSTTAPSFRFGVGGGALTCPFGLGAAAATGTETTASPAGAGGLTSSVPGREFSAKTDAGSPSGIATGKGGGSETRCSTTAPSFRFGVGGGALTCPFGLGAAAATGTETTASPAGAGGLTSSVPGREFSAKTDAGSPSGMATGKGGGSVENIATSVDTSAPFSPAGRTGVSAGASVPCSPASIGGWCGVGEFRSSSRFSNENPGAA